MVWLLDDAPECEGYLVAMVDADLPAQRAGACSLLPQSLRHARQSPLRELGPSDGRAHADCTVHNIQLVRVACLCGWRSRVFTVGEGPTGYRWIPYMLHCGPRIEHNAEETWLEHARAAKLKAGHLLRWTPAEAERYVQKTPAKGEC